MSAMKEWLILFAVLFVAFFLGFPVFNSLASPWLGILGGYASSAVLALFAVIVFWLWRKIKAKTDVV